MQELIVLTGPTASGKTALGIELAKKSGAVVVSADSRQVYAGLNIGTAKPKDAWQEDAHDILTADQVDGVPHYLLNIRQPDQLYTLAEWQQHAYQVIDQVIEKGQRPILVGGTMLYVDSIIFNYSIPAVSSNEKLREELATQPSETLYQQLLKKDLAAAKFIEPHHQQRIIRALEVIEATGQPFSASRKKGAPRYEIKTIGLFPGWETLTKNITDRAQEMFNSGLLSEVLQLREQYGAELPLLTTMNYLQAGEVVDNKVSQEEALQKIASVNIRYAHRQMSWWKNRKDITWMKHLVI